VKKEKLSQKHKIGPHFVRDAATRRPWTWDCGKALNGDRKGHHGVEEKEDHMLTDEERSRPPSMTGKLSGDTWRG